MIKANEVTVVFKKGLFKKKIRALDGFSITVERGDVFALLGPNGAGKSTAMYCFLGLIRPDRGYVTVFGKKPEPGTSLFEKIAYLPEEPHYHLYLTVEEAVRYYASLYRNDIPNSKVYEAIDRVGLMESKDLGLDKCSKGMKQKVGIATCLLNSAELIFLDEPTRGLDPIIVKEFRDILLEMNKQGKTIVINSHMLSEIEMVCNRAAIINKGRVVRQDELKNLMKFDWEDYSVEFDITENTPEYLTETGRTAKTIKGQIPSTRVQEFFRFSHEKSLKIYECSLKKLSLEDAFIDVLKRAK